MVIIMTTSNQEKVLRFMLKNTGQAMIKVSGISMLPVLKEGDDLQIESFDKYVVGDILVYNYKGEGLLVHRLLVAADDFMCKGDNAFRIEKISKDEAIGKVVLVNGVRTGKWEPWKVELSLKIGKSLLQLKNLEYVKSSSLYQMYATFILNEQLNIKVGCANICVSFVFDGEQYKCSCITPSGEPIKYTGVNAVIIFCAIQEKPIRNFVEEVLKYFVDTDFNMRDNVYYRICVLIENQTIVIKR